LRLDADQVALPGRVSDEFKNVVAGEVQLGTFTELAAAVKNLRRAV
jgi:hypothetical protein